MNAGDRSDDAEGRTGTKDGDYVDHLRVWSSLHADGKPSLDSESFFQATSQLTEPPAFNISSETLKDLQTSGKVIVNNYVYFKGIFLVCE